MIDNPELVKPGQIWRVENGYRWAKWKILDGETLRQARDAGYKGDKVICCVEIGSTHPNDTFTHEIPEVDIYAAANYEDWTSRAKKFAYPDDIWTLEKDV